VTDPTLGTELNRRMRELLRDGYLNLARDEPTGPPTAVPPKMHVHMVRGYVPVSFEQLVDAGAISEEDARAQGWTPPPPVPWRRRARWRWAAWRERAGRRVGGWIAGVDLADREEDW
jgi:hypothetical protein